MPHSLSSRTTGLPHPSMDPRRINVESQRSNRTLPRGRNWNSWRSWKRELV